MLKLLVSNFIIFYISFADSLFIGTYFDLIANNSIKATLNTTSTFKSLSQSECASACNKDQNCKSAVYTTSTITCKLYSISAQTTDMVTDTSKTVIRKAGKNKFLFHLKLDKFFFQKFKSQVTRIQQL